MAPDKLPALPAGTKLSVHKNPNQIDYNHPFTNVQEAVAAARRKGFYTPEFEARMKKFFDFTKANPDALFDYARVRKFHGQNDNIFAAWSIVNNSPGIKLKPGEEPEKGFGPYFGEHKLHRQNGEDNQYSLDDVHKHFDSRYPGAGLAAVGIRLFSNEYLKQFKNPGMDNITQEASHYVGIPSQDQLHGEGASNRQALESGAYFKTYASVAQDYLGGDFTLKTSFRGTLGRNPSREKVVDLLLAMSAGHVAAETNRKNLRFLEQTGEVAAARNILTKWMEAYDSGMKPSEIAAHLEKTIKPTLVSKEAKHERPLEPRPL